MKCSKCQIEFIGNQYYCKLCVSAYNKAFREANPKYRKEYYQNNKMAERSSNKIWLEKNPDYALDNNSLKYKSKRAAAKRKKSKNNPSFRLRNYISKTIYVMIKKANKSKRGKSILTALKYSFDDLKIHIEGLFEPWMNWNNQGTYCGNNWNDNDQATWRWQLDHIIPQSTLPYEDMECENFKKCWDLSNLRPLSAKQNYLDGIYRIRH